MSGRLPPAGHLFQSTLRRTERLNIYTSLLAYRTFQSTLRRTERLLVIPSATPSARFQSTLRRTERPPLFRLQAYHRYFNPRSDERSDFGSMIVGGILLDFNPRSDERSDQGCSKCWSTIKYFNPRSDERSDWSNDRFMP